MKEGPVVGTQSPLRPRFESSPSCCFWRRLLFIYLFIGAPSPHACASTAASAASDSRHTNDKKSRFAMDTSALIRVQMNPEVDRKVRKRRSLHRLFSPPFPSPLPPHRSPNVCTSCHHEDETDKVNSECLTRADKPSSSSQEEEEKNMHRNSKRLDK